MRATNLPVKKITDKPQVKLFLQDKVLPEQLKTPPQSEIKKTEISQNKNNIFHQTIRSTIDAIARSILRTPEEFIKNQYVRVLYRLASEALRKTGEVFLVGFLNKEKVTNEKIKEGLTRALEHVPATTIVEPNLFEDHFQRISAGLGNIALRFLTRFAFYKTGAINKQAIGMGNVLDDFFARTLFRGVYLNSMNMATRITGRFLEQLFINLDLHVFKFASKLFPKFQNLFEGKTN